MDKQISSDQPESVHQSPGISKLTSEWYKHNEKTPTKLTSECYEHNEENPTQTKEHEMTWQNHKEDTFKHFAQFARNDEFTDVIIFAGKKAYRVHKLILASVSTFFKDALAKQSILCFKPFAELHMLNILTYIYTGKCKVKSNLLHAFVSFAKFLNIRGLKYDPSIFSSSPKLQFYQPGIRTQNTSTSSEPKLDFEMKSNIPCKIPCNNCITRIVQHSETVKEATFFKCLVCGKIFINKNNLRMHQKNHEDQHNNDSLQHDLKKENIVEVVIKQEIDNGEDISEEITIQNNLKKEDDPDMEMNK